MNKKIYNLKRKKYITLSLVLILMIGIIGLISFIKPSEKLIKITKVVSSGKSLNGSVIDATGDSLVSSGYDEITYRVVVNKDNDDTLILTASLSDNESKYARFKEIKNSTLSDNGKSITVTTTSSKVNLIVKVTNAPFGSTIKPTIKINSEDESKQNVNVDTITINSKSIEGIVKTENGRTIGDIELSLNNNGEEVKRTYSDSLGNYVFSLPEDKTYDIKVEEAKYKLVRFEDISTSDNRKKIDVIVREITPFTLDIKKGITKVDLLVNGSREIDNYDDEAKVVKAVKNARTLSGSVTYKITIKNIGEDKGTLTAIKDVLHDGLSFDQDKNPGWVKRGDYLYYTPLESVDIEAFGTKYAYLVLDIKETKEAKTYINEVIAKGEDYKNVVYILNDDVYKELYVVSGEKIDNINPNITDFDGWYSDKNYTNKYNFNNEVTKDLILYGKVKDPIPDTNKYQVTFMDEDLVYATMQVEEGEKATKPTPDPDKSSNHKYFLYWSEDHTNEYNFDTQIYEDKILYAVYEDVLPPQIILDPTLDPATNETWVNEDTGVLVTIVPQINSNKTYYRIEDGDINEYTVPFRVYDNVTISAFSVTNDVSSEEVSKDVVNVDKFDPTVEDLENAGTRAFSVDLNYSLLDEESGIDYYEVYADDTLMYTSPNFTGITNTLQNGSVTITGLNPETAYTITLKVYDKVGLSSEESIEITTKEVIARIIGRANLLYEDESQYELYESVQDAFDDCGNIQCTVQIIPNLVTESATVDEGQDIVFDLDGKILTSDEDYTLINNGKLAVVDRNPNVSEYNPSSIGQVINTTGKAVQNNNIFALGEGTIDKTPTFIYPERTPYLIGNEAGIEQNDTFYFFDGKIKSNVLSIQEYGEETITQYSYNVTIANEGNLNVATLEIVDEPEARIKSTYYTKLSSDKGLSAVGSTRFGSYEEPTMQKILSKIIQYGDYGFIYNPTDGSIKSGNLSTANTEAISYVKIDLRDYTESQFLIFNTLCDTAGTSDYGYISVNNKLGDPLNRIYTTTGNDYSNYKIYELKPGKIHYIYFGFYKGQNHINEDEYFKVTDLFILGKNNGTDLLELAKSSEYYFEKQDDGSYVNNNQNVASTAHSFVALDLIGADDDLTLNINLEYGIDSNRNTSVFYISNTDSEMMPSIDDPTRYYIFYSNDSEKTYQIPLKSGKTNYIHFVYKRADTETYSDNLVKINGFSLNTLNQNEQIPTTSVNQNVDAIQTYNYEIEKIYSINNRDNDGTLHNVKFDTNTKELIFNGSNSYISAPVFNPDEFTISVNFKTKILSSGSYALAANYENAGYGLRINNGYLEGLLYVDNNYLSIKSDDKIKPNTEYTASLTYDGSKLKLYLNNTLIKERGINYILSNKEATKTITAAGVSEEATADYGKVGNGYAKITNLSNDEVTEFDYTGSDQTFVVPTTGQYKLEVWGASGGDTNINNPAGVGGYSVEEITLNTGEILKVYVGGSGVYGGGSSVCGGPVGGYNGGGNGGNNGSGSGGGATDIRRFDSDTVFDDDLLKWDNLTSLEKRIIVAGGGGGSDDDGNNASNDGPGGSGGGVSSQGGFIRYSESVDSRAGKVSGYQLGKGEDVTNCTDTGGAGGGYYGGFVTNNNNGGGAGGSGYLDPTSTNKHMAIYANGDLSYRPSSSILMIGADPSGTNASGEFFKGNIKDVSFYATGNINSISNDNLILKYNVNDYLNYCNENEITTSIDKSDVYTFEKADNSPLLIKDLSGNGNYGLYHNVKLHNKKDIYFDNYSNLTIKNEDLEIGEAGEETVEFIFNKDNNQNGILYAGYGNEKIVLGFYNGHILVSNTRNKSFLLPSDYNDGTNKHILLTYKDGNYRLFYNGEELEIDNYQDNWGNYNYSYIGRNRDGNYFYGYISQARIYNRALSDEEIANNYNGEITTDSLKYNQDFDVRNSFDIRQGSFIRLSNNLNLSNFVESVSVDYATVSTGNQVLYNGTSKERISIGFHDSYIIVGNNVWTNNFERPSNFADGNRHNITVTYDGSNYDVYFDNTKLEKRTDSNYYYYSNNAFAFVGINNTSFQFYGYIFDVKVYNRAVTEEEITNNSVTNEGLVSYIDASDTVIEGSSYFINNNRSVVNSTAHSFVKYDLTNSNEDKYLYVESIFDGRNNADFGYITVNNSPYNPGPSDTVGRYLYTSVIGEYNTVIRLKKGQINYAHFGFACGDRTDNSSSFIIKSIKMYDNEEDIYSIKTTGTEDRLLFRNPILNTEVSTVEMLKDIVTTYPVIIPENKEMILDLNGYILTTSLSDYIIKNSGALTIIDSEYEDRHQANIDYKSNQEVLYNEAVQRYQADLAEYEEYAGLCDGCEPSEEYLFDQTLINNYDYIDPLSGIKNIIESSLNDDDYIVYSFGTNYGMTDVNTYNTNVNIYDDHVNLSGNYHTFYTENTVDLSKYNSFIFYKTNFNNTRVGFFQNPYNVNYEGESATINSIEKVDTDVYIGDVSTETRADTRLYFSQWGSDGVGDIYFVAFSTKTAENLKEAYQSSSAVTRSYKYVVPYDGTYKLETWGASGGGADITSTTSRKGLGAYSVGEISLNAGDNLYIYVGGEGLYGAGGNSYGGPVGGYNGGGAGGNSGSSSGGGATDIRTVLGVWNNPDSLASRIIVAGGGGGSDDNFGDDGSGGSAGGYISQGPTISGSIQGNLAATQTSGYSLGTGESCSNNTDTGGAGGGYYGGFVTNHASGGGAGGSGYIGSSLLSNKHMTCYKCSTSDEFDTKTILTTNYSTDPISDYAKIGNGYARISLVSSDYIDEFKESLPKTYNVREKPIFNNYIKDIDINSVDTVISPEVIPLNDLSKFTLSANDDRSTSITTDDESITIHTSYSGNMTSTTYNDVIKNFNVVNGTFDTWTNNGSLTGDVYIGLARTKKITVDDYVIFQKYHFNSSTKNYSFNFINTFGEDLYFKIIVYHGTEIWDYTVYARLNSFEIINTNNYNDYLIYYNNSDTDDVFGGINVTAYHGILNEEHASLNVAEANINVNINTFDGIHNRGNLILGAKSIINVNSNNSSGIFNQTNGILDTADGLININGQDSIGLNNKSKDTNIDNLTIVSNQSSDTGIVNQSITDVVFDNLNISGAGHGFREIGVGKTTINNSYIASTEGHSIYANDQSETFVLDVLNSNLTSDIYISYTPRIVNISNCNLTGSRDNITNFRGTVYVKDSYLENASRNINNYGQTYVTNSNLVTSNYAVVNNFTPGAGGGGGGYDAQDSTLVIKDSTITSNATSNVTILVNDDNMVIDNVKFINESDTPSTAINNTSHLTIEGETEIENTFGTAINNTGYLSLGEIGKGIKEVYKFGYTGKQEEFVVPTTGTYKLETWGASGGQSYRSCGNAGSFNCMGLSARGGYASGLITLNAGDKLYIHVGGKGSYGHSPVGGYNGGGASNGYANAGGATDISLYDEDNIDDYIDGYETSRRSEESYNYRLIVAGGASGNNAYDVPTYRNGGYNLNTEERYQLGYGQNATYRNFGGAGGYYGGIIDRGGSSYVSEQLSNPVMIPGDQIMPSYGTSGTMFGNLGNGYARITLIDNSVNDSVNDNYPYIGATNYGIYGDGTVYYYDGKIEANKALYTDIEKVPTNNDIELTNNSNVQTVTLKHNDEQHYVASINNTKYKTLQSAVDAANVGDTIVILDNLYKQNTVVIDDTKNLTIDYNGHFVESYNYKYMFDISGRVIFTDSQESKVDNNWYGDGYFKNNGEIKIEKLKFYNTAIVKEFINNSGKVDIDDCVIYFGSGLTSKNGINNNEGGIVNIENTELHLISNNYFINNLGTLNIKNSLLENENGNTILVNSSDAILDNIIYNITGNNDYGRYLLNNTGNATIKNSNDLAVNIITNTNKLILENNTIISGNINNNDSGLVIINSGTYKSRFNINGIGQPIDDNNLEDKYSFIMNDGKINTTLYLNSTAKSHIKTGVISIWNSDEDTTLGKVSSNDTVAINNNTNGELILGIPSDGNVSTDYPLIHGDTYGIYTSNSDAILDFYDGKIVGNMSLNMTIDKQESGYSVYREYDEVNEIETKYLTTLGFVKNLRTNSTYNNIQLAVNESSSGDTLQFMRDVSILKSDPTIVIPEDLTITFDTNGYTVDKGNSLFMINNGTTTFRDSIYDTALTDWNNLIDDTLERLTSGEISHQKYRFDYTGSVQEFTAPYTGTYKLETWGASGGGADITSSSSRKGLGAYSTGEISLNAGDKLYVYVGGEGLYGSGRNVYGGPVGGYNGGGAGGNSASGAGGGASDIRTISGAWNNPDSLASRIIVAGGGGGSDDNWGDNGSGGSAGGYISQGPTIAGNVQSNLSATQTSGYALGLGESTSVHTDTGGAGGGYYGGFVSNSSAGGGAGGSGYIGSSLLSNKHMTCYSCSTSDETDTKTILTTNYSTEPISDYAKIGNGYVLIRLIDTNDTLVYTRDIAIDYLNENGEYEPDVVEVSGQYRSTSGTLVENNNILNFTSGNYLSERNIRESKIIKNNENSTINISNGRFVKYYDRDPDNLYKNHPFGSIFDNDGNINITDGKFYANGSYVDNYWRRIGSNSTYMYVSEIFKNSETGVINVSGGTFDGYSSKPWDDYSSSYYDSNIRNKGSLIENKGIATFANATINNTMLGSNTNNLSFNNCNINDLDSVNENRTRNFENSGTVEFINSNIYTGTTLLFNTGTTLIDNSNVSRSGGLSFSDGADDDWSGYKNSMLVWNMSSTPITIRDSNISVTDGNGRAIDNTSSGSINITNSYISSYNNNVINNTSSGNMSIDNTGVECTKAGTVINNSGTGIIDIKNNSSITTNSGIGINNPGGGTINLGIKGDGIVSTEKPLISGSTNGIYTVGSTFNFYDGYIKGMTKSIDGSTNEVESGFTVINEIDGDYHVSYLGKIEVVQNVNSGSKYYSLQDAIDDASNNDTLKMIANYTTLGIDPIIVNDKKLTLDLNGKIINQGNDALLRNNNELTIIDNSNDKTGEIIASIGSKVIDNYGTLYLKAGNIHTNNGILLLYNEAPIVDENTSEVISTPTVTIQDDAKLSTTTNSLVITSYGNMNIYNGAYIHNTDANWADMINNYGNMNIIDLNKDDDSNTSSTYSPPIIYSQDNNRRASLFSFSYNASIFNDTNATLNIVGDVIFNNGGSYKEGAISPDSVKMFRNNGTVNITNGDFYNWLFGYNYGTLNIKDVHMYNLASNGLRNYSGTIKIEDSIIELLSDGTSVWADGKVTIHNSDTLIINNSEIITHSDNTCVGLYNYGTMTINDSTINVNVSEDPFIYNYSTMDINASSITTNVNSAYNEGTFNLNPGSSIDSGNIGLYGKGTMNINDGSSITAYNEGISVSSNGTVNINEGVTITSTNSAAVSLSETSTVIVGENDEDYQYNDDTILLEGKTFGIINNSNTTNLYYYDGTLKGQSGPTALSGKVTELVKGHRQDTTNETIEGIKIYTTKQVIGSEVAVVASVGKTNFSSDDNTTATEALQNAIDFAIESGSRVNLNISLILDRNLTATAPITIKLLGNQIETYNDDLHQTFTISPNISLDDTPLDSSVTRFLADILDINLHPTDVVIYEMDDGSSLKVNETYRLYKDNNLVKLTEDEVGSYTYNGDITDARSIKGRLYLSGLEKGNYKLVGSDNTIVDFSVTEDGEVTGNVRSYTKNNSDNLTAIAIAELIITIQTGVTRNVYLFIIVGIMLVICLLVLFQYKKNKTAKQEITLKDEI